VDRRETSAILNFQLGTLELGLECRLGGKSQGEYLVNSIRTSSSFSTLWVVSDKTPPQTDDWEDCSTSDGKALECK
jgi:hypothetical protein